MPRDQAAPIRRTQAGPAQPKQRPTAVGQEGEGSCTRTTQDAPDDREDQTSFILKATFCVVQRNYLPAGRQARKQASPCARAREQATTDWLSTEAGAGGEGRHRARGPFAHVLYSAVPEALISWSVMPVAVL